MNLDIEAAQKNEAIWRLYTPAGDQIYSLKETLPDLLVLSRDGLWTHRKRKKHRGVGRAHAARRQELKAAGKKGESTDGRDGRAARANAEGRIAMHPEKVRLTGKQKKLV